jgi:uncharacterized protein YqiB (DUF1249 family)
MHRIGVIVRIYHDARSWECHKKKITRYYKSFVLSVMLRLQTVLLGYDCTE